MTRKLKKRLIRIIISLLLFVPIFITDKVIDFSSLIDHELSWLLPFGIYLVIYLVISYDILIKAFKNIIHGHVFDENFLMTIATFGAFAIKEFPEAVAVMLFYQIGEFFQDYAVNESRKEISSLMDIKADIAHLVSNDKEEDIEVELIELDNILKILPGEKVPVDGVIIEGSSSLDTKALTGESLPKEVTVGNEVISGTINLDGVLIIRATKTYDDSTVSKILELVENSTNAKSSQEKFITKFAKWYTPIVVISAVLLALIGTLITRDLTWIERALNFLVVSCPCAIVISVPLSFFVSIGRAAKHGILIKGSTYLENFNKAKTFVFDKTGTLTKGNFVVSNIYPNDRKEEIIEAAYIAEKDSSHPIALSIKQIYNGKGIKEKYEITNVPGKGIIAKNKNNVIFVGNAAFLKENNVKIKDVSDIGTHVYVSKNNEYLGVIVIKDEIKEESKILINYLSKEGIDTVMLTGDNYAVAKEVSDNLKLTSFHHSLLPQDKVSKLDNLINNSSSLVTYVGDGINDAPSLARSDIGIAMGALGSDAAIEASDIVLMNDNLNSVIKAKKIAKKTMRIVYENIIFALVVKAAILILSVFGIASIWLAIFGDVGVALLCVLNALRSGRVK